MHAHSGYGPAFSSAEAWRIRRSFRFRITQQLDKVVSKNKTNKQKKVVEKHRYLKNESGVGGEHSMQKIPYVIRLHFSDPPVDLVHPTKSEPFNVLKLVADTNTTSGAKSPTT